jgi:hypothetical protein
MDALDLLEEYLKELKYQPQSPNYKGRRRRPGTFKREECIGLSGIMSDGSIGSEVS